ncbi:MAG: glutamate racemase [Candidatus Yanofskybacteria bacterium RIFCSPHIGHO2_01_FULL_41_21]|uniref:Glutamate racemase n=1 Tax=Candidatus Yanofskybacteria bacterium RIFCSPHIGHO2_01_FULL_41_21 TaxID=1802660 RepID=A0A1F8EB73_9BACT|nr:MAG: glutamate racemase [Candidatus Yanofskybacteria bacterium RIFCSPHIGHO2_01_FULL_41_21]
MNNLLIGVFDSGVGGLSILKELQNRLSDESFLFFADQKNVPYGGKSKEELVTLTSKIMEFLTARKIKMVVIACNTATCYALEELRNNFPLPIVGVVPAIKPAVEQTKVGKIALISTPATAQSQYVTDLINKYANNVEVLRIGCAGLEDVVETGKLHGPKTSELLNKYVAPLKKEGIDQLVLGCTHYPFLKEEIVSILGPTVTLVDSGRAVANRVEHLLDENNLRNTSGKQTNRFFTNKDADDFSRVASELLGYKVEAQYASV